MFNFVRHPLPATDDEDEEIFERIDTFKLPDLNKYTIFNKNFPPKLLISYFLYLLLNESVI